MARHRHLALRHRARQRRNAAVFGSRVRRELPFDDKSFDLIISINTLHNLYCFDLDNALREIERVGKKNKYIVVES